MRQQNEIPTMKVKSGDSFATINESDYDPKIHELIHEDDSKANEPSLEQDETQGPSGPGGSGKRGGARGKNKTKDAAGDKDGAAVGSNVPEGPANRSGDAEESAAGSEEVEEQS